MLIIIQGFTKLMPAGEQSDLAVQMSSYWAVFGMTGNPNKANKGERGRSNGTDGGSAAAEVVLPEWPAYGVSADTLLRFHVASAGGVHVQSHLRQTACDYMEANPQGPAQ